MYLKIENSKEATNKVFRDLKVKIKVRMKHFKLKVNKSVYIAKSRQRYYKTFKNILLLVPNHALKDVYMLNYGIIKNTNSSYYTRFFVIKFFYHIISSKQTHLVFCTFPTIFER